MIKIKVKIENCLFLNICNNNKLPSIFTNWFSFSSMSHNYQTSFASKGNLTSLVSKQHPVEKNVFVCMAIKTF